ncbi:hypothetical protein H5410_045380 [Solanum commersonii]|uniref:Uncharacterized protein n=1 Tax=Solanum commersonii TaxID=4109 RepID=A0A9J5XAZ2_SOLCO|nr:hypothetical protein H5410_045380 [Solanum commersonii]
MFRKIQLFSRSSPSSSIEGDLRVVLEVCYFVKHYFLHLPQLYRQACPLFKTPVDLSDPWAFTEQFTINHIGPSRKVVVISENETE